MDNENKDKGLTVVVKHDEIENLTNLGFIEEDGLLVKETETGAVFVDPESGTVGTIPNDGSISINELGVVAELVASGVAETIAATGDELETLEDNEEESADDESS